MKKRITQKFTERTASFFWEHITQHAAELAIWAVNESDISFLYAAEALLKFSIRLGEELREGKPSFTLSIDGKTAQIIKRLKDTGRMNDIAISTTAQQIVDSLMGVKRKSAKRIKTQRRFY